ncbi:ferrochelatase [compost metagenome]
MTDCLETLHELAIEGREQFAEGGGNAEQFITSPCLNSNEEWLQFLKEQVEKNAIGWKSD